MLRLALCGEHNGRAYASNFILTACQLLIFSTKTLPCKKPSGVAMHLLRCLSFSAHFQFSIYACHKPGVHNTAADDISRGWVSILSILKCHRGSTPGCSDPSTSMVSIDRGQTRLDFQQVHGGSFFLQISFKRVNICYSQEVLVRPEMIFGILQQV